MKKIKRLELRTGQVLNPLQQGFVVGGHQHDWEQPYGCSCQEVGHSHVEHCSKVYYVTESSTSTGSSGFFFGLFGIFGWSGIGSGTTRRKKITCRQKASFAGFDEETGKIEHTYASMSDLVEYE